MTVAKPRRRNELLSRLAIRVTVLSAIVFVVLLLAEGCQDPTQLTLDIKLDTRKAKCSEISHGLAITIGVEPFDTEKRVESGYVSAKTTDCDDASGEIGTLVLTPSDPGHASVIVVVGYKENDPTTCKPPQYHGCIVLRRRFAFSEHTRLMMPLTVDPDCADVPCDAFSTCNKGQCFDSQSDCSGGACSSPGDLADGGLDEASVVVPDAAGFDATGSRDGDAGAREDTGADAPADAPAASSLCVLPTDELRCHGTESCSPTCCAAATDFCGSCPEVSRRCCSSADCPIGYGCPARPPGSPPLLCQPTAPPGSAYCEKGLMGPLYCPQMDGGPPVICENTNACCDVGGGNLICVPGPSCGGGPPAEACCNAGACGAGQCVGQAGTIPGRCQQGVSNDAGGGPG